MFRQQSMTAAIAADGRMVCLSATGRTDVGQTSTAIIGRGRDMDVVEKVARAMWRASGGYGDVSPEPAVAMLYERKARAAIAAVLEAVGEPEGWKYEDDEVRYAYLDGPQKHLINVGLPETPLYSLSPLTQALAAVENP